MLIECRMFKCLTVPMFKCVFLFIGSQEFLVHWSIGPLVECQMSNVIYQMSNNKYKMSKIKCQMPKVNKVELLSERTSGAPPVIVIFAILLR